MHRGWIYSGYRVGAGRELSQQGNTAMAWIICPNCDLGRIRFLANFVVLLVFLFSLNSVAANHQNDGFPRDGVIQFDPPTNDAIGRHFEIKVPPVHEELTPAGWVLSFPGHPISESPGHPQLGGLAFLLPGQMGHVARVEWLDSEFEDRTNFPVAPVTVMRRIHLDDTRYRDEYLRITNKAVYASDQFLPPVCLTVNEGQMATQRWVRLICHPNQYLPTRQILRCHRRIEGVLFFAPSIEPPARNDDARR